MKKFFAIALALILLLSMVACSKDGDTEEEGGEATKVVENDVYTDEEGIDSFTYVVNERGSYDISGFSSTDIEPHKVEIPSKIDNIEVTGIAAEAFKACNQISEIVIPDSVISIGECAFARMLYLEKVTMADSVKTLGTPIQEVIDEEVVSYIKGGVFDGCTALVDVTLSGAIEVLPQYTFRNCIALEKIVLPKSVKEIAEGAFWGCDALVDITLPEALEIIGDCAFYEADALAQITVPASVKTIGKYAFTKLEGNDAFVVESVKDSAASEYAEANGHVFKDIDAVEETPAE